MKRLLLCGILLLLLIFPACQSQAGDTEAPRPVDAAEDAREDHTLPGYLTELTDWDKVPDMECTLSRDDTGIQITPTPVDVMNLAKCLLEMELVPYGEIQNSLELPHPFSLTFHVDGNKELISVSREKVSISGTDYSPTNPGALSGLLESDHSRFLTGDIYLLQEHMLPAAEITEVRLEEYENYSDGVTRVSTTDRKEIGKIAQALSRTVARRFETGEEPSLFIGVGGNGYFCTLILEDGRQWSINPRGLATVTSPSGQEDILVLSMDHQAVFGLLASNRSGPSLQVRVDDMTPTVYERAYQVDGLQKSMSHIVPTGMYFDSDPVLLPKETYTCRLEWTDAKGNPITPAGVTATLYPEAPDDPARGVGAGIPLRAEGATLTLPGGVGRSFVSVRAELADSGWVEFIFSYRSSIFPTAFYDISFGNDEGGVTLTRNDADVEVTGTQNRQYVDFVMGLELSPSTGQRQALPVREPFTMAFSCDNTIYEFVFSNDSVTYNGQPYTVGNPQAIEELYAPFDMEDPNMFERVNYDLRGFLTKNVAYFTDVFPFRGEDIEKFTIIKEEPDTRILHDMSGLEPKEIMDILGYVVLGKDWQTEDYYTLRRFYLSYAVVLKDGTTYEIGERILKNNGETGWYTIQSDAPLASRKIERENGDSQQRDVPIHGGIGMDDEGNIIID